MRAGQSSASSLLFTQSKTQPMEWCHLHSQNYSNTTEKNPSQAYPKTDLFKTNLLRLPFQVILCYAKLTSDHPRTIPNPVILLLIRSYWCLSPGCAVCAVGSLISAAWSTSFQQPPVPVSRFILTVCIWKLIHMFWFHQWCSLVYAAYCLCFGWLFKRGQEQCQLYDIVKLQVSHKSLRMVFLQLPLIIFNVYTESKEAHEIPRALL